MWCNLLPYQLGEKIIMVLPVNEIFGPTISGEGSIIGLKTMFVRFAYCDYKCTFCDTKYAVDVNNPNFSFFNYSEDEIVKKLMEMSDCRYVSLTGGNPALFELAELIRLLKENGYWVNIETQGSIPKNYFDMADLVTFSPKPPSSGMILDEKKLLECMGLCKRIVVKVVLDLEEFDWFMDLYYKIKSCWGDGYGPEFIIQVKNDVGIDTTDTLLEKLRLLVEKVLSEEDLDNIRILPQLHVLLWGNKRGV